MAFCPNITYSAKGIIFRKQKNSVERLMSTPNYLSIVNEIFIVIIINEQFCSYYLYFLEYYTKSEHFKWNFSKWINPIRMWLTCWFQWWTTNTLIHQSFNGNVIENPFFESIWFEIRFFWCFVSVTLNILPFWCSKQRELFKPFIDNILGEKCEVFRKQNRVISFVTSS